MDFLNSRIFQSFIFLMMVMAGISCSESTETRLQRFLIQGNEAVKKQNYEQATGYFEAALQLDSCFADALNNLGTMNYNQRDYTRALEYYSKAIACRPGFQDVYLNRSNAY